MTHTVTHRQLRRLLEISAALNEPLMIRGAPGIGKSDHVEAFARDMAARRGLVFVNWAMLHEKERMEYYGSEEKRRGAYFLFLVDLLTKLPEDLVGLPRFMSDYVQWTPDIMVRMMMFPEVAGIAFFDELAQSQQAVQKPVANMFLNGILGTLKLSDGLLKLAASNRQEDRCGVFEMLEHMKNRMGHCTLQVPSTEEWVEWALAHDVAAAVVSFIGFMGGSYLFEDLSVRRSDAYATPRSWASVSRMIAGGAVDTALSAGNAEGQMNFVRLVATRVGEPAAEQFCKFLTWRGEVDHEAVLSDPEGRLPGMSLDHTVVFASWMAEQYGRKGYPEKIAVALPYMEKEDLEVSVLTMIKQRTGMKSLRKMLELPVLRTRVQRYRDLMGGGDGHGAE